MKLLYLDCSMGIAGDMLTAALYELLDDKNKFIEEINNIGLSGVKVTAEDSVKQGIKGTHMLVTVNGVSEELNCHHEHNHNECHCDSEHISGHLHSDETHIHSHEDEHLHFEAQNESEEGMHTHHEALYNDDSHIGHEHLHSEHHEHSHEDELHNCFEYDKHIHHEHSHNEEHTHEHHHSSIMDIENIINSLAVSDKVKSDALNIYKIIAEAESYVHNTPVSMIHFHEVGAMDAVSDIVSVCCLMEKINPDKIIASPINTGKGHVHCAHGIMPVPAPATAYILKDLPIYNNFINGELCTPTGAALLKYFCNEYDNMPIMKIMKTGYGMGTKDFEQANCLRAFLSKSEENTDTVSELRCNIDDMTPEKIGFVINFLLEEGALDVYTIALGMKKSRPGVMLNVICTEDKKRYLIELIMKHTTTLGIRESRLTRYILNRHSETYNTIYGEIRIKSADGYGSTRRKIEYDDITRVAKEKKLSMDEAAMLIEAEIEKLL